MGDHHDHASDHDGLFAAPGHDHTHCAEATLARAERICAERGARLTAIRRQVLEALAGTHAPIGAYELIERLENGEGHRPAPITVYRALDFLIEQGLAHRLASKNAYIASANAPETQDTVAFLICESCGSVDEVSSQEFSASVAELLARKSFRPKDKVLEISGQCIECQASSH
jgi:Fur family transcriptional regulator, zinc uptake regulator